MALWAMTERGRRQAVISDRSKRATICGRDHYGVVACWTVAPPEEASAGGAAAPVAGGAVVCCAIAGAAAV
ncbi:MAG: hypothetical protein QOI73_2533, partial [Solirubrobacteraceae bacterium]|nr:hypothetical protein [Solirubrobacteraceae bacterium]